MQTEERYEGDGLPSGTVCESDGERVFLESNHILRPVVAIATGAVMVLNIMPQG